jgi:hypothetical protein
MAAANFSSSSILMPNTKTRRDGIQHESLSLEVAWQKENQ